jgi:hypothetical protein
MKYVLGVTLLAWLAWSSLVSAQETGDLNLYIIALSGVGVNRRT